ncbi:PH domain-containing protein [Streptomyces sp. NPDC001663]|uniref:PH domain-containing protein n=1 Tax=Streptomyces sp. NPDC001663 TaxID=3364597 RepID=UPI0036AE28B8
MDVGGVEREYRKRRKLPRAYLLLLGAVMLNALLQTGRLQSGRDHGGLQIWASGATALLVVAAAVRATLEQYRAHTRVTAVGITAQWPLRSHTWAWHEVYDIRVQPSPRGSGRLAPQWLTHLYDMEGRRFRLPHLDDWQLDDPFAEVSALCLAAAPYRSLAWERRPQVEERIVRRAAGRKAWTWAAYSTLAVLFAMYAVDLWQVAVGRPEHPFLLLVCVPLAFFGVFGTGLQRYWTARPPRSLAQQP